MRLCTLRLSATFTSWDVAHKSHFWWDNAVRWCVREAILCGLDIAQKRARVRRKTEANHKFVFFFLSDEAPEAGGVWQNRAARDQGSNPSFCSWIDAALPKHAQTCLLWPPSPTPPPSHPSPGCTPTHPPAFPYTVCHCITAVWHWWLHHVFRQIGTSRRLSVCLWVCMKWSIYNTVY